MNNKKTHIIGIAGGSSSGKTFLCNRLTKIYNNILSIKVDSYYRDFKHLAFEDREKINFDHPSCFEFSLLHKQLNELMDNKKIKIPIYNYKDHTRSNNFYIINNKYNLILVEGIFSLYRKKIRDLMTLIIFIDVPNDIRKSRRIHRDKKDRARSVESIIKQYHITVEPMYKKYVKPTIKYADIIINKVDESDSGYNQLINRMNSITNEK